MSGEAEYRIDFAIMRRLPGEDDFTEYAFGSTGPSTSIDEAAFDARAAVQTNAYDITAEEP